MSEYVLELPEYLLERAKQQAFQQQISLNRLLVKALEEQFSTVDNTLIEERAKRADITAYRAVLAKVPHNPVAELDRK